MVGQDRATSVTFIFYRPCWCVVTTSPTSYTETPIYPPVSGFAKWMQQLGLDVRAWSGIRAVFDHMPDKVRDRASYKDILAVEKKWGRIAPYRVLARYVHVLARKRPTVAERVTTVARWSMPGRHRTLRENSIRVLGITIASTGLWWLFRGLTKQHRRGQANPATTSATPVRRSSATTSPGGSHSTSNR